MRLLLSVALVAVFAGCSDPVEPMAPSPGPDVSPEDTSVEDSVDAPDLLPTPDPGPTDDGELPEDDTSTGCEQPTGDTAWQVLTFCEPHQLLSVWASGRDDVWAVGAGGTVLRFDGCTWTRPDPGTDADLWWVFGVDDAVYMSGAAGTFIKWTGAGGFQRMDVGSAVTLFGLWGTASDDLWTVGFDPKAEGGTSVLLRWDGTAWTSAAGLPEVAAAADLFKVWGDATSVWVVGRDDLIARFSGDVWETLPTGLGQDWVTVSGSAGGLAVVGGTSAGMVVEQDAGGVWTSRGPEFISPLQGLCFGTDGDALATGAGGTFLRRTAGAWEEVLDAPFDLFSPQDPPVEGCSSVVPDYHACVSDGAAGYFVAGGNFFGGLTDGALLYFGAPIRTEGL